MTRGRTSTASTKERLKKYYSGFDAQFAIELKGNLLDTLKVKKNDKIDLDITTLKNCVAKTSEVKTGAKSADSPLAAWMPRKPVHRGYHRARRHSGPAHDFPFATSGNTAERTPGAGSNRSIAVAEP